jgi:hypothetical protein
MMFRRVFIVFLFTYTSFSQASNFYVGVYAGYAAHESTIDVVNKSLIPVLGFDFVKDYQAPDDSESFYALSLGYQLGKDLALELGYTKIKEYQGDPRTFLDLSVPVNPGDVPTDNPDTNLFAEEVVETDFMSVSLVGQWPIHKRWAFHAKLGVAAWKYRYTQVLTNINDTALETARANGGCPAPEDCPPPIPNPIQFPSTVNLADYDSTLVTLDEFRTESYSDTGIDLIYGMGIGYGINKMFEIRFDIEAHSFNPKFRNINVDTDLFMYSLGFVTHF